MLRDTLLQMAAGIPSGIGRARIEAAVRAYLDSYAAKDIEGRAALFADDVVVEEPVGGPPMRGKAALVAFWNATVDAGWTTRNDLERIVVCGDEALIVFTAHLAVEGQGGAEMQVFENLAFDPQGRIVRLRAFNDASCVS
jgi:ketosteroid isomerase-like protein